MDIQIEASWKELLADEFEKPYFIRLVNQLKELKSKNVIIYPPGPLIFRAFDLTPVADVKVVLLGQDPYHGIGEATGLCFSVPKDVRIPPSLSNIYKEIESDLGITMPTHGTLDDWAKQGLFMLNAILTVENKKPGSHKNIGWQEFTNAVIKKLSDTREGLIFLLWGKFAQGKMNLIDPLRHHILTAAHPSPLARNAFSGSKHFSQTNTILKREMKLEINWKIE